MVSLRLKELRKNNKITQKQIANAVELSERNYQYLEYGTIKPSYDTLLKLADYFDVSLDYLVGRTNNPKINK
jgi:transcriptional regulator with XRE-family HTH domain